jgi:hypothetical protein
VVRRRGVSAGGRTFVGPQFGLCAGGCTELFVMVSALAGNHAI